jgi:hypothetical protein
MGLVPTLELSASLLVVAEAAFGILSLAHTIFKRQQLKFSSTGSNKKIFSKFGSSCMPQVPQ